MYIGVLIKVSIYTFELLVVDTNQYVDNEHWPLKLHSNTQRH